jgi:hypothetical protein
MPAEDDGETTQWLTDFEKFAAANDARYLEQINVKLYELFRASKAPEPEVSGGRPSH